MTIILAVSDFILPLPYLPDLIEILENPVTYDPAIVVEGQMFVDFSNTRGTAPTKA